MRAEALLKQQGTPLLALNLRLGCVGAISYNIPSAHFG